MPDIRTHSDAEIDASSWLEETVRHNVTTVAMHNGLSSLALGSKPEILDPF